MQERDKLVDAREALDSVWQKAHDKGCRARGWGSKTNGGDNPLRGSNITLAIDGQVVIVNLDNQGQLQIHSYSEDPNTDLS
jgi:hypothetical protein